MIDVARDVLKLFLDHVVIPEVVALADPIVTARYVKEGCVRYARAQLGTGIDLAARHFGKSTRWIYRVLEGEDDDSDGGARKGRKRKGTESEGEIADNADAERQQGAAIMTAAVEFFLARYPREASAADCARALKRAGIEINGVELSELLDLYVSMGHLIRIAERQGKEERVRYKAIRELSSMASFDEQQERLARLANRIRLLPAMARSYVGGHPHARFTWRKGQILEEDLEHMLSEIDAFLDQIVAAMVVRTREKSANGGGRMIRFDTLYLSRTTAADSTTGEETTMETDETG